MTALTPDHCSRARQCAGRLGRDWGRRLLAGCVLLGLAACGGGGGGRVILPPGPPPEVPPPGIVGDVRLEDFDLGRIGEQEPNNSRTSSFALPPIWAGCALEVTGLLGTTATRYGAVDPTDVLRFVSLSAQSITLDLVFEAQDQATGGANDVVMIVFERDTGTELVRSVGGPSPQQVAFDAVGGQRYDIVLSAVSAHTYWLLRIVGQDPPGMVMPKPSSPESARVATEHISPSVVPITDEQVPQCASEHVLVRLTPDVDVDEFCRAHGLVCIGRTALGSWKLAPQAGSEHAKLAPRSLCDRLCTDACVANAEPDWIVQTQGDAPDPEFARQWYLRAIGAPAAWEVTKGSESIVIAILDSGIIAHPDLVGRLDAGFDFVSSLQYAADGDGRDADPTDPGDQFLPSGLSAWHGTHVAAIAVARQDDIGMTGVAPGCRALPLRVVGRGGGLASDAADAILYAAGLHTPSGAPVLGAPLRIANLSFGLSQDSTELRDACNRAATVGVFLVGAAGNTGQRTLYPAAYDSVFAVSAVDARLLATPYSNFGVEIDIVAPGGLGSLDEWGDGWPDGILSAGYDDTAFPKRFTWRYLVGTSQAAPQAAAAAALLLSLDPTLTIVDLRSILRGTARDVGPVGIDQGHGAGLLQVQRAVDLVLSRLGQANPVPPSLLLPAQTVKFHGFEAQKTLPLLNAGGGSLLVTGVQVRSDDGAPWLNASLIPADTPGGPISHTSLQVSVDRNLVPPGIARYSGTVFLNNLSGVLGTVRVMMFVGERVRAGENFTLVTIDPGTGGVRSVATVSAEFDYRFWLRSQPQGTYLLKAGDDLDGDGIFCEAADVCGWYGGTSQATALPLSYVPETSPLYGLTVFLHPPP